MIIFVGDKSFWFVQTAERLKCRYEQQITTSIVNCKCKKYFCDEKIFYGIKSCLEFVSHFNGGRSDVTDFLAHQN